jgi:predicted nucleic acid-binding protein
VRDPTVLTAVNAAEVIDQLVRVYRRDADDVHADLALLAHAGMEIVELAADQGLAAGRLRARHYHRQRCPVSLADCVAAALALERSVPLATSDPALAAVVRAEGGHVHGLVDSTGVKP